MQDQRPYYAAAKDRTSVYRPELETYSDYVRYSIHE